jgi:truncated hemoglobin YjbI
MALDDDTGGASSVRAALDAFYPSVLADPALSPYFLGVDIEQLKKAQEGFLRSSIWA